jgi:hypothetical protein
MGVKKHGILHKLKNVYLPKRQSSPEKIIIEEHANFLYFSKNGILEYIFIGAFVRLWNFFLPFIVYYLKSLDQA